MCPCILIAFVSLHTQKNSDIMQNIFLLYKAKS